jgi:hypothetical protein
LGSSQAVGRFYAHLLEASGHRLASARRNPLERQIMLVERSIELAAQTCHQPTMTVGMTQAFVPIVAWLHSLSRLIRPSRLDEALSQHLTGSLEWLVTTAQSLGVAYPTCLRHNFSTPAHTETVLYGGPSKAVPRRGRPPPVNVVRTAALAQLKMVLQQSRRCSLETPIGKGGEPKTISSNVGSIGSPTVN